LKNFFSHIEDYICTALMSVMLLLAFTNVLGRYIFRSSIAFTEEITTSLFVLLALMGTAIAAEKGTHLGLTLLTDRFPVHIQRYLCVVSNLICCGLSLFLLYRGILMVQLQIALKQISITLQIPEYIYGSFLPIGAGFMAFRFGQAAWRAFAAKKEG